MPLYECYFEALELMSAPKGLGPRHPTTFILQTGPFWECRSGGHDGDHGPRQLGLVVSAYGGVVGRGPIPRCGTTSRACGGKEGRSPDLGAQRRRMMVP
jgi:hypothetical protein